MPISKKHLSKRTIRKARTAAAKNVTARTVETPPSSGSIAKPDADLRREAAEIKELLLANDKRNSAAKYDVAVRVMKIVDGEKRYGEGAVEILSEMLGLDSSLLYAWAEVARAWPDRDEFLKVVSRLNKHGMRLTWSHAQILAKAPADERNKFIEEALAEGLSVRGLKILMDRPKSPEAAASSTAKVDKPSTSETITAMPRNAAAVAAEIARWRAALETLLESKPGSDILPVLEDVRTQVTAMVEEAEAMMKALETALAPLQTAPSALMQAV